MLMQSSEEYETALRGCTLCAEILATKPVDPARSDERVVPRPIVRPLWPRPVMLVGQAPGLKEYESGNPFSGPAGMEVRGLFAECGCGSDAFERSVHTSAVAKCFPGSKLTKRRRGEGFRREDLKPTGTMLKNCRPFFQTQIDLVAPKLLVLLGRMALEAYLELRDGKKSKVLLEEHVGRVEEWAGRRVVALAHTSGGSFWLNKAENKARQAQAKRRLTEELAAVLK